MEIVKMADAHVASIAEIEKLCFSDPWSEKSIASELTNRLSLWLVALDGDRVTGYIGSQSVLDGADMMNVAVHPDYRRQGIGKVLVEQLIASLQKTEVKFLMLEVRASNAPAIALYTQLGFAEVGRRKNYYRHPREDAIIMRKEW